MRRLLVALLLIGCGPKAIEHSGYPDGEAKPWAKAKTLKLDERYEAKIDGTVSYPKKERARWYVVDLPADGKMTATITITIIGHPEANHVCPRTVAPCPRLPFTSGRISGLQIVRI